MIVVALLLGCPPAPPLGFSMLAEPIGEGMLLSAWQDGDVTWIVGGDLHGGPATLVRWDGESLSLEASPAERALWWIHGPRPGSFFAVGEAGLVLREQHGTRTREDLPTEATLYGVWSTDEVTWAVGGYPVTNKGEIWRRDQGGWALFADDLPGQVFKVWDDVFVGAGVSWRLVGDTLVPLTLPTGATLTTVRGDGETLWAVGGVGGVYRLDDDTWIPIEPPRAQPVFGMWTSPDDDVWVTGAYGLMARKDGQDWDEPDHPLTARTFHAAWRHGDDLLFVGGDFFSSETGHGAIGRYRFP